MKIRLLSVFTLLLAGTILSAQDKAEIHIKILKDGEIVKDTLYSYDDVNKAKHAVQMMELLASDDSHFNMSEEMKLNALTEGEHHGKKMMFISENGVVTEFEDGDITWDRKSEINEGDSKKVFKMKMKGDSKGHDNVYFFNEEGEGENVYINEDGKKIEVIIKNTNDTDQVNKVRKEIIVVSDGDDATWTMDENENGEVIVSDRDGKKIEMIKISESDLENDGKKVKWVSKEGDEDVNVVVIKKEHDTDQDVDIEVIVKEEKEHSKKNRKNKK